jgi:hypothetical protein
MNEGAPKNESLDDVKGKIRDLNTQIEAKNMRLDEISEKMRQHRMNNDSNQENNEWEVWKTVSDSKEKLETERAALIEELIK